MTVFRNFVERKSVAPAETRGPLPRPCALPFALLLGALMAGEPVQANPTGGKVVSGTAKIVQSPKRLEIVQDSDKAIIDWRSFSIDADEHTRFRQPSSSSITLNRVTGDAYSHILGQLTANGRIMLVNPNGILFGGTANVDVAGLVATTIDIRNEDFMAGRFNFDVGGNPGGTVVNRGRITVAEGGLAALVAPGVENSGVVRARLGRVTLASGNSFTLDLHGDNLIQIRIGDRVAERLMAPDGVELNALVGNRGTISADGGTVVLLAASVAKDVVDYAINMEGIVEARTAVKRSGRIVLQGTGEGIVRVTGTLDASGRGSGETGGSIKVLGEKVGVVGEATIDATGDVGGGEILVGGNFQGRGPERNAEYTTVGGDAVIRADAITVGDGGRVIVWSDRVTRFFGNISARGGSVSGGGGFAEVSGKRHLRFAPTAIDLSAPNGSIGELLLDPRDITIEDNATNNDTEISSDNTINFGDGTSTDFVIQPSAFEAVDADVTLQAERDITVSSAIDRSGSGNRTLVLQAGRHLTISADITGTNGAHSFIFEADSPQSSNNDGTGTLTISSGVTITSNNGDITLIGAGFEIDTSSASINAGTGDIHVAPSQSVAMTIGGTVTGNLSNAEIGRFITSGTIHIGTATTGPTSTGGAGSFISASSITVSEALTITGSASLEIDSSGTTTLGANVSTADGNITFSDAVSLSATVRVDSDSDNDSTDGNITFSSTVNGAHDLTIEAGTGRVTLSGNVTLSGANALLVNTDAASGAITIGASVTSISTVGGAISFGDNVTLNGTSLLTVSSGTAGGGDILFSGTVGGGRALTIEAGTGRVTLSGNVTLSGANALLVNTDAASGPITIGASVTSISTVGGAISFGDNVTLNGTSLLTVSSGTAGGGDILFSGTVSGGRSLTIEAGTGRVTLSGNVTLSGANALLVNTDAASGAITIGASVTSISTVGGAITFGDAVTLNGTSLLTVSSGTAGGGDILFSGTVSGGRSLTIEAGTGRVTLSGNVTLSGANALSVNTDAASGAITIGASVTSISTVGGAITFGDAVTLNGTSLLTVSSGTAGGGDISPDGEQRHGGRRRHPLQRHGRRGPGPDDRGGYGEGDAERERDAERCQRSVGEHRRGQRCHHDWRECHDHLDRGRRHHVWRCGDAERHLSPDGEQRHGGRRRHPLQRHGRRGPGPDDRGGYGEGDAERERDAERCQRSVGEHRRGQRCHHDWRECHDHLDCRRCHHVRRCGDAERHLSPDGEQRHGGRRRHPLQWHGQRRPVPDD